MEITLLGTGGAGGWPQPWCHCASCESAHADGEIRSQTSVLVDGTLLLDCGQDTGRSAVRQAVRLDGVRHLFVTHDHFDHSDGALLLARHWARARESLDVWGPPSALESLAQWLPPDDPGVSFRPLVAGDTAEAGPYRVRALAAVHNADGALLYDVTGPDGRRLLYATDTGPGFEVPTDARYDAVLLEESWGDRREMADGNHHDLTSFPQTLARLRRCGAIDDASRVLAIHTAHGNPAPSELRRRLAAWGAELPRDGDVVRLGNTPGTPARPRRVLVLGGARSGKSVVAEGFLAAEPSVTYVATSNTPGGDAEWSARVEAHRARRPAAWRTIETLDIARLLRRLTVADPPVLIDCTTVWLARVMDECGLWSARDIVARKDAEAEVARRLDDIVDAWRTTRGRAVAVSNEVGSGVVPEHASGRRFRDELGALNARLAAHADDVLLVVAGITQRIKGSA